jgi:DinB superfamily
LSITSFRSTVTEANLAGAQNRRVDRRDVLLFTMDEAYTRLRDRLEGLTEDEFFWKTVPKAWTIYEDRPGHWTYDYAIPDPIPPPVTTIAWQVTHLATTRFMYHEWAYGAAKLTFPQLEIPDTVAGAIKFLADGYQALRADLEVENDLDQPRKTNWGEMWPAWRIFTTMTDHDALHSGTIGCLRDLYLWTRAART